MNIFDTIEQPTLLLNTAIARRNIQRMCEKAQKQQVRLRPHFKTHQSAEIGEWFRQQGVDAITVSSLDMANYFARFGWNDIIVAFPVNLRQTAMINDLASRIHLGLLVEAPEAAYALGERLKAPVDVWIKIDSGTGRTGINWQDTEHVGKLIEVISTNPMLHLRGLLTHAGLTYHGASTGEIIRLYLESVKRMFKVRSELNLSGLEISVGDTPGCSLSPDLGSVDEIRPGNFVFYDAQQISIGSCSPEDVAVAVACPVVAKHPERNEIVVYGGAIHLSKDYLEEDGLRKYGYVALPNENGWGAPLPSAYVRSLSQEHGLIHLPNPELEHIQLSDLVCILPAHSCLTIQVMRTYLTLTGETIHTLN
jgi:D-serine deaminase-like pyridoxal phosphate-dependent protein